MQTEENALARTGEPESQTTALAPALANESHAVEGHTPGPWEVAESGIMVVATPFKRTVQVYTKDRGLVDHEAGMLALVYSPEPFRNVHEANARLIAAAPDLLAALKTTRGNILSGGPAGAFDRVPMVWREWLAVVDAAIAKAEGR